MFWNAASLLPLLKQCFQCSMNKHLWVCSYNPHHQISIRIYLKHVMAELRKSSLASVCQDLWKHQVESCLQLVNQDCCWKNTNNPAGCFFFIVMFLEYKGTTGDLVNTFHCSAADRRDQSPSASVVTTLHLNSTGTSYRLQVRWDNPRWRFVWETRFSPGCQAQLPWSVTVPPVSWQNPTFLFHSDIATTGRSSFFSLWLETFLSLCSKNGFYPLKPKATL